MGRMILLLALLLQSQEPPKEKFSSAFYGQFPDADDRLAKGGVEAWGALLMDTLKKDKDGDLLWTWLPQTDLEALVGPVLAGDKDPTRRRAAIQLIVDRKLLGAMPTVAKGLESPDPALRVGAAEVLGRFGDREQLNGLLRALRDPDAAVVVAVIEALKRFWSAADRHVAALVGDRRVEVRRKLLSTAVDMRAHGLAYDLRPLLKDDDLPLRAAAAMAVAEVHDSGAVPLVTPLLTDQDPGVRRAAAWSLGVLDAKNSAAALVERFADADPSVRARAAEALGRIQVKDPKLPALLEDPDPDVRVRAAWSLGQLGFGEAELRRALTSDRPLAEAARALGRLGCEAAIPDIVGFVQRHPDPAARGVAVMALGDLGGAGELRKLLGDPEPVVRWAAARSLGRLNEDADYKKLLTDADVRVRLWAGLALARRGLRDGVDVVLEAAPKCPEANLFWLNRLHSQQAWNRLDNKELDETLEGTLPEILPKLLGKGRVKWVEGSMFHRHRYQPRYRLPAGTSLMAAFDRLQFWSTEEILSDAPPTLVRNEFLLQGDGMSAVSPSEALQRHRSRLK